MKVKIRNILYQLHLWLGLAAGAILFIVCLSGALYTFRTQIENVANYKKLYVEVEGQALSLDSIRAGFIKQGLEVNQFILHGKANRSLEMYYTSSDGSNSGMYYVNPYSGVVIGNRNTVLSPFFEFVLSVHKTLLLNEIGKQIVGAAVLIFVFMLLSGFVLWAPKKLKNIGRKLRFKRNEGKARFVLDLHQVGGFYSLGLLFLIAIMGLYISYPWVKSSLIVAFGGNPVLSQASDKQSEKIKQELAASFSESLAKIMAQKNETSPGKPISLDTILQRSTTTLAYKGITTIILPTSENSWITIKKVNRENLLRAIVVDELNFNSKGELKGTKLFKDLSPDQKFIALSLPLHTGEIMGWPSLIVYFLVTLVGASLPITGTLIWYRRKKAQRQFSKKSVFGAIAKGQQLDIDTTSWLIVYATKSGNAKLVASELQKYFLAKGLNVHCKNISAIKPADLQNTNYLFAVASTDGKGVPPPTAQKFFGELCAEKQMLLNHLQYSVCALGDSAYEHFCETGKVLDNELKRLDAKPLIPRIDCDADFAEPSVNWIKRVWEKIAETYNLEQAETNESIHLEQKKFREASVKKLQKLSKSESYNPVYHLELETEDDISFIKPGDSIEIKPINPKWLAKKIAQAVGEVNNKEFICFLQTQTEITTLTKSTLKKFNSLHPSTELTALLEKENELNVYINKANVFDMLIDYVAEINASELKRILPRLKTRLYSVASSPVHTPKQIDLCVKPVRFHFKKRKHEGAASVQLTEQLKVGNKLSFRHCLNLDFRLPENTVTPIIMIGVGTGIAPFRAFLQQRETKNVKENCWLIWGDKTREHDFLYEEEIKQYVKNKTLARLDLAFSRDQEKKVYVQHLLSENSEEILNWLKKGAHIYVCGSIKMGEGVKSSLLAILNNNNAICFDALLEGNRYHEDAY